MSDIPYGYCQCGCGQKTSPARDAVREMGRKKGDPNLYLKGHFKSPGKYKTLRDHFLAYCFPGDPDECWDWTGSLDSNGYGHFKHRDKKVNSHRVAYEIYNGEIPPGMSVCHKCDRRLCNNPNHLFLGTQRDNMADMYKKNRHAYGERNGISKLNPVSVREIRNLHSTGKPVSDIARKFDVSARNIRNIINRDTWRFID